MRFLIFCALSILEKFVLCITAYFFLLILGCLFLGLPKSCCSITAFGDVAAVSDDYVESSPSSSGYLNSTMDASSHEDNQSERVAKMNQNSRDNNKMIKICDKLIGVFLVDKPTPTDWRKLLAFSREWDNIRPHFFKRCQEKADTELNPEMKHNLLRLGRKLKEVMHLLTHSRTPIMVYLII
jgi:hypothetical protein